MYTYQTDGVDITTWNLPEDATARLGTGWISGDMAFSPDGGALVVATTIGCWWYDLNTMELRAWWNTEQGMLSEITFSHDGQWVATGDWEGDVRIYETQNLQCVAKIGVPKNPEGVMGAARSLRFSQDGQHLTLSHLIIRLDDGPFSRDRTGRGRYFSVYDWKVNTDTSIASFTVPPKLDRWNFGPHSLCPQALSPDGSLIAYTSAPHITSVMHTETGEPIAEFPDDYTDTPWKGCNRLVFSPCGKYLVATNYGNKYHIWNVQNETLEILPTEYMENSQMCKGIPTYTSDGTLWIVGFSNRKVVIWNATLQKTVNTFECWMPLNGKFSNEKSHFALRNIYGELQVWTRGNPSTVKSLPTHISRGVIDIRFSKDSRTLLSCHDPAGYRLWDVAKRQVKRTFSSPFTNLVGVVATSHSRELLAVVENKQIRVWNLTSDTQIAELLGASMKVDIVFSPSAEYIANVIRQNTIRIWDLASNSQVAELSQNPSPKVLRMGFSRTGKYFVSVHGDSFTIWDTTRWEKRHDVTLPMDQSYKQVLFHPKDKHVILVPNEDSIFIWDLKSGEHTGQLDTTECLDPSIYRGTLQDLTHLNELSGTTFRRIWGKIWLSPCDTHMAGILRRSKIPNEIRIWDSTTLETCMVIIPPKGCEKPQTLRYSPCGKYLAVGAQWQEGQKIISVRLWDVETGENIHTFWGHRSDVWSLDFSPDGELLASGSYDGTILLWDVKPFIGT
ncbi:MAG: WD40 repeat domain-containing protein [Candidatus Poribacteria bacterium]|nr:WD40 repeat domain-containing protein [Candidatus Poribacteria bacterium]